MKKQITVTYSTTVEIEIPDGITEQEILDADESRVNISPKVGDTLMSLLRIAHYNIGWRDGVIADIQDCD